ncbi:MAG: hypothetical protein AMK69_08940 [Nitrospira bacterium SG8_3]|nr:MAG: hypothetical protein AMK69_08940 [Nitrospira bacterium SG8_3]
MQSLLSSFYSLSVNLNNKTSLPIYCQYFPYQLYLKTDSAALIALCPFTNICHNAPTFRAEGFTRLHKGAVIRGMIAWCSCILLDMEKPFFLNRA